MKPYFTHHCTDCSYLGSADINGRKMDFYHCGKSFCKHGTILWRESDEESDYSSCPVSSITALNKCAMLGFNLWLTKRDLSGWSEFKLDGTATFKNGEHFSVSPNKDSLVECMERLADKLRRESIEGARAELMELAMMVLPDNLKRKFAARL